MEENLEKSKKMVEKNEENGGKLFKIKKMDIKLKKLKKMEKKVEKIKEEN